MAKKRTNGHNGMARKGGVLRLYRSYNHVDKDPAIDKLRTVMQDEHLDSKRLAILSNVGKSTIDNWMDGKTRRPQHITLAAAAAAMGFGWELQREAKKDYVTEMDAAERWHRRHHTKHAKEQEKNA